jgi:flagellar protein FlbD
MIEVTRLNGIPMTLNSDLIKIAESSPDTMLTLIHGEKLIVRESRAEVMEKILAYRAQLLAAVAARLGARDDLPRVVAMASLNPNAAEASGSSKSPGLLHLESGGK